MSIQLVTLAFEAAPALAGATGDAPAAGPTLLERMVRRYVAAAQDDAARAEVDQRSALDKLIVAEKKRLEAKAADAKGAEQGEDPVGAARAKLHEAAQRYAQARSDGLFAETRAAKAAAAFARGRGLDGRALRTFATERLRQLEEITRNWGADRPSRDRVLLEDLRSRFHVLALDRT